MECHYEKNIQIIFSSAKVYSQLSHCRHLAITDTPIIQTANYITEFSRNEFLLSQTLAIKDTRCTHI